MTTWVFGGWTALVLAAAVAAPVNLEWAWRYVAPPHLAGWTFTGFLGAQGRHLAAFAGTGVLVLAMLAAAARAGPWIRADRRTGAPGHLRWIAGLAAGSFAMLGLGLTGLLDPRLLWTAVAAGAVAGLPEARALWREWRGARRADAPEGWLDRALAAMALVGFLIALLAALAPLIGVDAIQYYFAAPLRALAKRRYLMIAGATSDGYPHAFELLYVPALLIGREPVAKLLTFLELALAGRALSGLLRDAAPGRRVARAGTAVFWTLPFTGQLPQFSYSDLAVLHGATVALWLLKGGRVAGAALAAGWLLSLKYSGIIPAAAVWTALLPRARSAWRPAAFAALAAFGPWGARNWLHHGNALWPLAPAEDAERAAAVVFPAVEISHPHRAGADPHGWTRALSRPWDAHAGYDVSGITSFATLWLLPVAAVWGGTRAGLGVALALWLGLSDGTLRYLAPLVPWIIAGGLGALAARGAAALVRPAAAALGALGLAAGLVLGYGQVNPMAVVLGAERPGAYLHRILLPLPHYMAIADDSARLFRGGATYIAGDVKAYYWTGDFQYEDVAVKPRLARWIEESASPGRLRIKFRQANVRHLVACFQGMLTMHGYLARDYIWTPARLATYQAFWERHMEFRETRGGIREMVRYDLFDVVPRAAQSWPSDPVPFTLPGTERLTWPGDRAWLDGDRAGARRWFARAALDWPGFAVPRRRLAALGRSRP